MSGIRSTSFFACCLSILLTTKAATISPSVTEFFGSSIDGNLTKVSWAHAVNSKAELDEVISTGTIMMIEADIVMGTLEGSNSTELIPVMGHPPANTSDISLEEFLNTVLESKAHGVKLDFKTIEVFNESLPLLERLRENMTFPVWINADIISGPVDADTLPVDAATFLSRAAATFPESTLSIGWTTRYGETYNITDGKYSAENVAEMLKVVADNNVTQPISYPVRAGMAAQSLSEMQTLINESPASAEATLTIWTSEGDEVDTEKLQELILTIGVDKVYVDVTDDIWAELNLTSSASGMKMGAIAFGALLAAVIFVRLF